MPIFSWLSKVLNKNASLESPISLRCDWGEGSSMFPEDIAAVSSFLGRELKSVDSAGFVREILGAKIHLDGKRLVSVESRSRERRNWTDITIKIHWIGKSGTRRSA